MAANSHAEGRKLLRDGSDHIDRHFTPSRGESHLSQVAFSNLPQNERGALVEWQTGLMIDLVFFPPLQKDMGQLFSAFLRRSAYC